MDGPWLTLNLSGDINQIARHDNLETLLMPDLVRVQQGLQTRGFVDVDWHDLVPAIVVAVVAVLLRQSARDVACQQMPRPLKTSGDGGEDA